MLSCRDVAGLSSRYLDRDLPWRRRLAVRLHLLMCAGCTRYYEQMKLTLALLRQLGVPKSTGSGEAARSIFRAARRP